MKSKIKYKIKKKKEKKQKEKKQRENQKRRGKVKTSKTIMTLKNVESVDVDVEVSKIIDVENHYGKADLSVRVVIANTKKKNYSGETDI